MPSAGDVERARALKEEGNELVKKGNHKQAIEKYSESLWFSNLESATYSNRYLPHGCLGDLRTPDLLPQPSLDCDWLCILAFSQYRQTSELSQVSSRPPQ